MKVASPSMVALLACCGALTLAAATPAAMPDTEKPTIAAVLDDAVTHLGKRLVDAAEAMPEEKYGFAPTNGEFKGVKTFGEQVSHIADDNYLTFSLVLGEKSPAPGATGSAAPKSKLDIVTHLRESFELGRRAAASVTAENAVTRLENPYRPEYPLTRLGVMLEALSHSENHYGQIVEYLRMNGIIPPASRPPGK